MQEKTSLEPAIAFGINKCSVYNGGINKELLLGFYLMFVLHLISVDVGLKHCTINKSYCSHEEQCSKSKLR